MNIQTNVHDIATGRQIPKSRDFLSTWFPAFGDSVKAPQLVQAHELLERMTKSVKLSNVELKSIRTMKDMMEAYEAIGTVFKENVLAGSFVKGYGTERILQKMILDPHPDIQDIVKQPDKARHAPGDFKLVYKGKYKLLVEVKVAGKSKTPKPIEPVGEEAIGRHRWRVNISHRDPHRVCILDDGKEFKHTFILQDEYDVLALDLFNVFSEHIWVFAAAQDLPLKYFDPDHKLYAYSGHFLDSNISGQPWPLEETFTVSIDRAFERAIRYKEKEDESNDEVSR